MSVLDQVKDAIKEALPDAEVHAFAPDDRHFEAIVISDTFNGLPLVKQHQKVKSALKTHFEEGVHALALRTFTKEKWEAEKHNFPIAN